MNEKSCNYNVGFKMFKKNKNKREKSYVIKIISLLFLFYIPGGGGTPILGHGREVPW